MPWQPWANAWVAHLLSVQRVAATVEDDQAMEVSGPGEYDEVVFAKNMETVDAFSSQVIHMKAEKAYAWEHINVMTQALWAKRKLCTSRSHCAKCIHWAEER